MKRTIVNNFFENVVLTIKKALPIGKALYVKNIYFHLPFLAPNHTFLGCSAQ